MRILRAAVGTAVFFIAVPSVVAGVLPWWITGWHPRSPLVWAAPLRVVGFVLIVAGVIVLLQAFARFVTEGLGTPAPIAPTAHLVIGGLYRYVRNPMYLAVIATLAGQVLILQRGALLAYLALVTVAVVAFVHLYEQPALQHRYGAQYEHYRTAVTGWLPRIRPYHPDQHRDARDDE